jgi:hypothetical protein
MINNYDIYKGANSMLRNDNVDMSIENIEVGERKHVQLFINHVITKFTNNVGEIVMHCNYFNICSAPWVYYESWISIELMN